MKMQKNRYISKRKSITNTHLIVFGFCAIAFLIMFVSCKASKRISMTASDFSIIKENPTIPDQNPDINISGDEDSYRGYCVKKITYRFKERIKIEDFQVAIEKYTFNIIDKYGGSPADTKVISSGVNSGLLSAKIKNFELTIKYERVNDFEYICEMRLE
jgi:hypothetical protein